MILEVKGSQAEVESVINYDVIVTESAPFHLTDAHALNTSFEIEMLTLIRINKNIDCLNLDLSLYCIFLSVLYCTAQ